jgi:hypothetical protein
MAQQARLDVLGSQRLPEQRVVHQIDLANGEIVCGAPIRIKATHLRPVEGAHPFAFDGSFLHEGRSLCPVSPVD